MKVEMDFSDFKRMEKTLKKLGGLPQKCVTRAARKGATVVRKEIKKQAPKASGALRKGLKIVGEKHRAKGKKVYQTVMDRGMNDIFQKPIQEPGKYGGKKDTAYYPASMEYGFKTESGREEGRKFMEDGAEAASQQAKKAMEETLVKEVEKEWKKKVSKP